MEGMFKTRTFDSGSLPLVVEPEQAASHHTASLVALYAENRAELDAKLLEHGAILFRGFGVATADELALFARAAAHEGEGLSRYTDGTSPRSKAGAGVYTSTEYPPDYFISLHNELSYTHKWPRKAFFCCATPPQEGGETPIVDSRALLRSLPPDLVGRFREKGVRYVRNLHGGRGMGLSWQQVFETEDRAEVENYCREGGVEFNWKNGGGLRISQTRPATTKHPETGEEVWFNQADQFHTTEMDERTRAALLAFVKEEDLPKYAYFGDGSQLDVGMLDQIREATRRLMVLFTWRAGDLLMVDNTLVAHGRMPFKGPRKILVALS